MKKRPLVLLLFFCSGAAGLMYEVVWTRLLTLVFGNTIYAVSTVLASFMTGLALGSMVFGRLIDRQRGGSVRWTGWGRGGDVLRLYALLEAAIGLYALITPLLISGVEMAYVGTYRAFHDHLFLYSTVRFLLSFLFLLPPTIMMGATLPVLSKFFITRREEIGEKIGLLYALNTLGAVVGCFTTGFIWIQTAGSVNTLRLGALLNFLVAVSAWWLARSKHDNATHREDEGDVRTTEANATAMGPGETLNIPRSRLLVYIAAFSGFTALSYEVLWSRALVFFMDNSVYAFTSMLTTFLFGLALGSAIFGRLLDNRRSFSLLGWVQVIIGLWAVFSVPMLGTLFYSIGAHWKIFNKTAWGQPVRFDFLKAFMVMIIPTTLMGVIFPLINALYTASVRRLGRSVGNIYAMNTVGSTLGSLATGFVVVPLIGIERGIMVIALLNVALGAGILWTAAERQRGQAIAAVVAIILLLLIVPTDTVFYRSDERVEKLMYYREGTVATVKAYEGTVATMKDPPHGTFLSINGYIVAGTTLGSHEIQLALGHIPLLLYQGQPKTALIVGFGAGGTSWAMGQYDLQSIDCVEFVPEVLKAAPSFPSVNHGILSDPRFHVTIDDGRNYLLVTQKTYDIMSIDAIDPKHAGNGNLYTREFYELCKQHLNPDGVLAQWLPYHILTEQEARLIIKTFHAVFPHATLWFTRYFSYLILIGTNIPHTIDFSLLKNRIEQPHVREDLKKIELANPYAFLYGFAMDERGIENLTQDVEGLNTYDRPRIEYYRIGEWERMGALPFSQRYGSPPVVNIGDEAARNELQRYLRGSDYIIMTKFYASHEEQNEGIRSYRRALELLPDDQAVQRMYRLFR